MQADTEDDTLSPSSAKDLSSCATPEEDRKPVNGRDGRESNVSNDGSNVTIPPLGGDTSGSVDCMTAGGLCGADSTTSSTSGILTDASSTGIPSSITPGVGGLDEESEITTNLKTEINEHTENSDSTPTDRQAPSLHEVDEDAVMEAPPAAAEVSDQTAVAVTVLTQSSTSLSASGVVTAGGADEDLSSGVIVSPSEPNLVNAIPVPSIAAPPLTPSSPLAAVVDSCPTSDFTALEGAVPMEEEEELYGPTAASAVHSGLQRPTSLSMHTGAVQLGTGQVAMSAYGQSYIESTCGIFAPTAQAPSANGIPTCGGGNSEHYVMVHINAGETFSVRMGDQLQNITGPATVRMVSNNGPPVPMPMQVPPGHMVQQIVDETGILTHVILSPHPAPTPGGPPAGPPPPPIGPSSVPQSGSAASAAQSPTYYSHPHHHPGSAGSPGLYTQPYGGPPGYGGPASGPSSANGPSAGCASPHRHHQHHYYNQSGGQGYIHGQAAVVSSTSGVNNGGQQISHCNGPSSGMHETRTERTKARQQARPNKRQQQQQSHQSSASASYHHIHVPTHHHNYHNYHPHDRRQYSSGPSSGHHSNVGCSGPRLNGDLSPHRVGNSSSGLGSNSHYHEDASSLSGGEDVPMGSSGTDGGHFHPGAAHHHTNHLHHSHSRHQHQSGPAPVPPAAQQPCSLTEDERKYVQMLLSSMPQPKVSDVEGRRSMIQIVPPEPSTFTPSTISTTVTDGDSETKVDAEDAEECCTVPPDLDPYDFVFELYLTEKGPDGKYDLVFRGEATEISLRDLKPACEYHVKIRCLYEHVKGNMTQPVRFMTEPAEPNTPRPPLISSRTKNTLNLRWAPNGDNGAKITNFLLYWDSGTENLAPSDFTELYIGPQRNYRLAKLTASTDYRFRLAAANCRGTSEFSDIISYTTSGTAPTIPEAPTLSKQHVKALTIAWIRRSSDLNFSLQMEDKSTSHGFLPVYHGPDLSYTITNLRRNTEYQFRLAANNEEGASKWSPIVSYRTLPDRPCPPTRLQAKGKVRPDHFKVFWEAPDDDGGSEVQLYAVEITQDVSSSGDTPSHTPTTSWSRVYSGTDLECLCSNLRPGRTVRVRGYCQSAGGWSDPSSIIPVPLPPVVPSACPAPQLQGKPKAISLLLIWQPPEDDGGAQITTYEVKQEPLDAATEVDVDDGDEEIEKETESRIVYSGRATNCTVAGLRPGRGYLYLVRASNKAGFGPWSNPLRAISGPGVPDAPKAPCVTCRHPHSANVSWQAPLCNGAEITEYRLEWQPRPDQDFSMLFTGDSLSYEVKGLQPVSTYSFRVLAHNTAGSSPFSPSISCQTPPGPPGQINALRATSITAHSVLLIWPPPADNGSEIISYYIDMGERQLMTIPADKACSETSSQLEYYVEGLTPETTFKLRMQAVNAIGVGVLSSPIKVTTLALPPTAPQHIECVQAYSNALKLRWGESGKMASSSLAPGIVSNLGLSTVGVSGAATELTQFTLEFSRQPDAAWQIAYTGPGHAHKVARLLEMTEYYFRVTASNEAGQGESSPVHTFCTTKAIPPAVRAPRITELSIDSCRVEWSPLKPMGHDRLIYILQLLFVNGRNADHRQLSRNYKEVYRGSDNTCRLSGLIEGTDYLVRVAAIRQCLSSPTSSSHQDIESYSGHLSNANVESAVISELPPASLTSESSSIESGVDNALSSTPVSPVTLEELIGPFSPGVAFTTRGSSRTRPGVTSGASGGLTGLGSRELSAESRSLPASLLAALLALRVPGTLSDQQWAILILIVFACCTCVIAFLLQHLLFANESGSADSL